MNLRVTKYKFSFLIVMLISVNLLSQSNPKLSNYEFSPLIYNPAFAGSDDGLTISSVYSTQWMGFEGAPETQFFAIHSMVKPKIGVGIEIFNDKIGATKETKLLANFAYKININQDWKMSMGIKAGVGNYSMDFSLLNIENPIEFNTLSQKKLSTNINFGTGFYIYNGDYYFGISIPSLVVSEFYDSANEVIAKTTPHYYLSTGKRIILSDEITFWPTILFKFAKGAPVSSLINLNANWNNKLYGSLNFDPKSSVGGYFGIKLFEKFVIGYSYDTSINNFNNYNSGNHSIFFKVNLNNGFYGEGPHSVFVQ
tara:strand:+ start:4355 stop:5287 length:933 start_codon:yes stop_codon:yes gene_type:complete